MICVRLVSVGDVLQHHQGHDRDGLAEVQQLGGLAEDLAGLPGVGVHVGGGALGGAGQQRPGVGQHDRVIVHVDDARLRRRPLGHLVGVVGGRQAGADVQELPHPGLVDQVLHRPAQERPVGPDAGQHARVGRDDLLGGLAVGLVVVLAAEPVVVDPGRVGHADIERQRVATARTWRVRTAHGVPPSGYTGPGHGGLAAILRPRDHSSCRTSVKNRMLAAGLSEVAPSRLDTSR